MTTIDDKIKEVFNEIATSLETGKIGTTIKIGLTINGSELGLNNMEEAVTLARKKQAFDIVTIGTAVDWEGVESIACGTEEESYDKMEELLAAGYISGCVTLHYNFPIGVATVGRVITPALGKELLIATTTGTTSQVRNEAMIYNAINGIAVAKSLGNLKPTVGVLNIDGARTVERSLRQLAENGYPLSFGESRRQDGGAVMRGNDLLLGSCDVMVCDSLTGNLLMKLFSSYTTGGQFESLGFGYGPGVGKGYHQNILIVSRASGAPVIANALSYAYDISQGQLSNWSDMEYKAAGKAGLNDICKSLQPTEKTISKEIVQPLKEVVTEQISGIDVMELEDAVLKLWETNIYAESGMGCTGPIILVSNNKLANAEQVLKENNFL